MTPLPSPEAIVDVIGCIYQAAYDSTLWPTAVTRLRDAFHGSKACLGHFRSNNPSADAVIAPDADPLWAKIYVEQFFDNELSKQIMRAPPNLVYSDHALVGNERMRASRFWNEWMAPQNMYGGLGCSLGLPGDAFCFIDIQRGPHQPRFEAADAQYLQHIVPHLIRAGELNQQLQATHALATAFSYLPFGVIFVNSAMTILSMNAKADALLARPHCALSVKNGQLSTHSVARATGLEQMVAQVCSIAGDVLPGHGGDIVVRAPEGGSDLILSVAPMMQAAAYGLPATPCAAIFVRDLLPRPSRNVKDQLKRIFALTSKEAAIAEALAADLPLKDIAARENITLGTARFYLHNVFQKTGTKRQSHLVSLLKNLQPIINHD